MAKDYAFKYPAGRSPYVPVKQAVNPAWPGLECSNLPLPTIIVESTYEANAVGGDPRTSQVADLNKPLKGSNYK